MLAILAEEMSIAEAARNKKVLEQSIGRWKAEFIEAGRTAPVAGRSGPSSRKAHLVIWHFLAGHAVNDQATLFRIAEATHGLS